MPGPPQVVTQAVGLASDLNLKLSDLTGPVSYVTGGVTIGASAFGLSSGLYAVLPMDLTVSGTFYIRIFSVAAPKAKSVKIMWFTAATNAQVGNGTNLSAEKVRVVAFGV
jgi:hypothetical protein